MDEQYISRSGRLAVLERLLFNHPEGMRATDIALLTGVNRRTVYRDIEVLGQRGVPIWQDAGRFGIEREAYRPAVRLSVYEAAVLVMAAHAFAAQTGAYGALLAGSIVQLAQAFPLPIASAIAGSAKGDGRESAEDDRTSVLQTVAKAWATQRPVRLWYGEAWHDVSIYLVTTAEIGGVHIVGVDMARGRLRVFGLERVEQAQLLDGHYDLPADFDAERDVARAWRAAVKEDTEKVVLRFSPEAAPAISARMWHPSQEIVEAEDGGCQLTLYVRDLREVRAWALGWGAHVQVVAPQGLREDIAREARNLALQYA